MAILAFRPFQPGFRLFDGTKFQRLFTGQESFTPALAGLLNQAPQILTAAGATQGNATLITSSNAIITVAATASTHGVKLPVAVTGMVVDVGNLGAFGSKVYPNTNGKIGAASTNAADSTVLAINKCNTYRAVNTTQWVVQRGA